MKPIEKHSDNKEGSKKNGLRAEHFTSPEGWIFILGLVLSLIYIGWLGGGYLWRPDRFQTYLGITVTHIFFGRAAGLTAGYAMNYGHNVVITINIVIETLMVLLFYPLFIFSWRSLVVVPALRTFIDRMTKTAEARQETIRRFGIPGLFLFVCFPFWMTGPLIGCIIGFMMGLRNWLNLGIVLGGTYLATIIWAVFLKELNQWAAAVSRQGPILLVGVLIFLALLGYYLGRRRRPN